ncbi:nucleotide-binding domain containing protein [Nonomuraea fuscirosea]|uniref:nucleotide-binding domain containing protein n=1 Tax=Nonomuraea fuscirosea TaxID=1291556 RepID=UPI0033D118FA
MKAASIAAGSRRSVFKLGAPSRPPASTSSAATRWPSAVRRRTIAHLHTLGRLLLTDTAPEDVLFCAGSGGPSCALASTLTGGEPDLSGADLSRGCGPRTGGRGSDPGGAGCEGRGSRAGDRGRGAVLAVSGSRSPVTVRQIGAAERAGWKVADVSAGQDTIVQAEESLRAGCHTIVQSSRGPARDPAGIGELLGRGAAASMRAGVVRRLVAGGDTSGQVVAALGARALGVIGVLAVGGRCAGWPPMIRRSTGWRWRSRAARWGTTTTSCEPRRDTGRRSRRIPGRDVSPACDVTCSPLPSAAVRW